MTTDDNCRITFRPGALRLVPNDEPCPEAGHDGTERDLSADERTLRLPRTMAERFLVAGHADLAGKAGYQSKRLELPATIKADPAPERRRVTAIASTPDVDRHGDVVEQNWDLTAYRKNPVICRDHDAAAIVGRAIDIGVTGGRLMVEVEFLPAGVSEIADRTYAEIRANALNAVSVGFRVVEASPRDGGRGLRITKAELLEISFVGIPANASALITARSMTMADRKALIGRLRAEGRRAEVDALRHALPPARTSRPTKAALLAEIQALKAWPSFCRKYVRTTRGEG